MWAPPPAESWDAVLPIPHMDGRILQMQAMGRATVEDLRRVQEKAELVGGEMVRMTPAGGRRRASADRAELVVTRKSGKAILKQIERGKALRSPAQANA